MWDSPMVIHNLHSLGVKRATQGVEGKKTEQSQSEHFLSNFLSANHTTQACESAEQLVREFGRVSKKSMSKVNVRKKNKVVVVGKVAPKV